MIERRTTPTLVIACLAGAAVMDVGAGTGWFGGPFGGFGFATMGLIFAAMDRWLMPWLARRRELGTRARWTPRRAVRHDARRRDGGVTGG